MNSKRVTTHVLQGWTYGLNEDVEKRRSPHLVHYTNVDEAIKVANRNTASETVRTLLVYGYVLDPPSGDKVRRFHVDQTKAD